MVPILVLGVLYCIVQLATVEVAVGQLVPPNIVCYVQECVTASLGRAFAELRLGNDPSDIEVGTQARVCPGCIAAHSSSRSISKGTHFRGNKTDLIAMSLLVPFFSSLCGVHTYLYCFNVSLCYN